MSQSAKSQSSISQASAKSQPRVSKESTRDNPFRSQSTSCACFLMKASLSSFRKLLTTMGDGSRDIIMKDSEIQQKLLNSPILLHGFLVISSFIMFIMGEVHLIKIQLQLQKIFPVLHKNLFIYFNTLLYLINK